MPVIELSTFIAAPVEIVFDLSRSIDLHTASTAATGECAIAGVTSGLIGPDEQVTWRARHLGVWQTLTSRISAYERLTHFADSMVCGAFARMEHHHYFESSDGGTHMRDVFDFCSPFGMLGKLVDFVFLTRYMRGFLVERNRVIKDAAESDEWSRYLPEVHREKVNLRAIRALRTGHPEVVELTCIPAAGCRPEICLFRHVGRFGLRAIPSVARGCLRLFPDQPGLAA